ncbi:LysR family transcriptional regulator [Pseudomonas sp. REP124]|uniref:LysR substrate-binding domain-containing protein n=1 Tax=Pseudomonas sp. REP124 TaxID=2875731 RepID=UPI001CC99486|nr:LysR substrate-binding domain-containing protein [Pseudomonas sp. REP124]MBZ9783754.1 LysR family transcriptional regulator [Pseudomonas sp. REP124]
MSIRDIETFRALMTTGSTSRAATMLGVSQSAVSQAIRKLETRAELQLFIRTRGRLVPTQEALALMVDVDHLFVGVETIEHKLKSLRQFGIGELTVAIHPALGNSFVPRALAAFDLPNKSIRVVLKILSSKEVYQHVLSGQCDIGIMADEMPASALEHSPFLNNPGVIVMSPSHPLARRPVIKPVDLAGVGLIALNPEDSARNRFDDVLNAHAVVPNIQVVTAFSHTICEMAMLGLGVGFVDPISVCDFIGRGLVVKPFSEDVMFKNLMVFRHGKPLHENVRQFMRMMRIQLERDLRRHNAS